MTRSRALLLPAFVLALAWSFFAMVGLAYADDADSSEAASRTVAVQAVQAQESGSSAVQLAADDVDDSIALQQEAAAVDAASVQNGPDTQTSDKTDSPDADITTDAVVPVTVDTEAASAEVVVAQDQGATSDASLTAQSELTTTADGQVDMYRMYNPNSGEHFYTAEMSERKNLVVLGWRYEGVGWIAPASSSVPVYRLYNPNAGDHHYTLDAAERDNLVSLGWNYEGIGWYSDSSMTVRVFREYNPNAVAGAHNFTTSSDEDAYLGSVGWSCEGTAWYALDYGYGKASYIYLDAGHGWGSSSPGVYDPGAGGSGYEEAEQTAELVELTAKYARELYGLNVYTNVDSGVQYWNRQADASARECTSFVSIHFNASGVGGTGTESYIHDEYAAAGSSELQSIMHNHLVAGVGLRDRGMKEKALSVCNGSSTGIPATLLEVCFIDNSYDMQVYKQNEDRVARELAAGLAEAVAAGF